MSEKRVKSEKPELGAIQETLLIPLYGRANDARSKHSVLHDVKAIEIVDAIDYDFSQHHKSNTLGSVLRSSIFDEIIRDFLTAHPDGTVVDLGCGLSTRFDRLDNGTLRWIDLDVEDSIALRRRFFEDSDRYTMIADSLFSTDWYAQVPRDRPILLVCEAVLLYFSETEVYGALQSISEAFPGAQFAFDTAGKFMFKAQDKGSVYDSFSANFKWQCDDPTVLEPLGLTLEQTYSFGSPPAATVKSWPTPIRLAVKLGGKLPPAQGYKFSTFKLTP